MLTWDFLIAEDALTGVLPAEYACFARPIRDALTVFLDGLPEAHQVAILSKQEALPPGATHEHRLGALAQSCPVLHKLGQVLARDQRLSLDFRQHLQSLESLPPSVPLDTIKQLLEQEFGDLRQIGVRVRPPAVAEASVAVVIPFFIDRGAQVDGLREGVFKILKPGIQQRLEEELRLLNRVGRYLDERCDSLHIPKLDYEATFKHVHDKLLNEVRLDQEQRHLAEAQVLYASMADVQIPRLMDFCTPRVTAMQRITGGKITDRVTESTQWQRDVADVAVRALIATPILSTQPSALFHGDPHAGNLFLTDDQRLGILDWSLAGTLGEAERQAVVQILLGGATLDMSHIVSVMAGMAEGLVPDGPALRAVVEAALKRIRNGQFPGLTWLTELFDDAVQTARLRVTADMMLLRKTLHTLQGVLGELKADAARIDGVLVMEFLRRFLAEWPDRWFASPASRSFATRLSNWDLVSTILNGPSTAARFWIDCGLDVLQACDRAPNQIMQNQGGLDHVAYH